MIVHPAAKNKGGQKPKMADKEAAIKDKRSPLIVYLWV
jgi:hypothetical protein